MTGHGQIAEEYFKKGYNCSQSVAAAFAPEMGMTPETAIRLAAGFGGGVGRMREVCGAFSGVVLVLGALYGQDDPATKTALYTTVQQLAQEFRDRNGRGALRCRELLGLDKPEGSPVAAPRTEEYYKKRPCVELVGLCADILEAYVNAHPLDEQREVKA